ncbi:MarR family winged helix-turn-helix transcriptional regulator [Mucisphaera calidilacus]|uniref:Multiple antibiotic resistance protein MarR n=1 Tax=Mucisphaera calidilacus TaxID=2527982 RepID=A0A518C026_9BACT|nr:MarR family transcriptional regulator [Mucisphaera calidilacus]QDU72571.1 Multiple antibiotic resistance protein MarR [Mucisphaera calidilacus]
MRDMIDGLLDQWSVERPDLDARPMAVVGRVLRLAHRLEGRVERVLEPFGLALWQFDVLATLRRSGPGYCLSPTALTEATMLSSGAMTHRIDRLVSMGWVERRPDPDDRRGRLVALTPAGRDLVDAALEARFEEARAVTDALPVRRRRELADALRVLLLASGGA